MSHGGLKLAAPSSAPRCNLLPAPSSRGLISREAQQCEEVARAVSWSLCTRKKKNRGVLLGSDEPTSKPTEGTAARPPGRKVLVMTTKPTESTRMSSAGVRPRQHSSRDLLVQLTPAQAFVVCGRGTHGLKGASLRTQLLADVGQCLQQAP